MCIADHRQGNLLARPIPHTTYHSIVVAVAVDGSAGTASDAHERVPTRAPGGRHAPLRQRLHPCCTHTPKHDALLAPLTPPSAPSSSTPSPHRLYTALLKTRLFRGCLRPLGLWHRTTLSGDSPALGSTHHWVFCKLRRVRLSPPPPTRVRAVACRTVQKTARLRTPSTTTRT